jgi:hypothetical protein
MGYVLGKAEGVGEGWHGHVTAVTVAPEFRCAQLHVCDTPHWMSVTAVGSKCEPTRTCCPIPRAWVFAHQQTHDGLPPSPLNRRQRLAAKLMDCLEDITTRMHDGYYVDLFVRASNKTAIQMYTKVHNTAACKACCSMDQVPCFTATVSVSCFEAASILLLCPVLKATSSLFSLDTRCIGGSWVTTAARRMHMICGRLCREMFCRSQWCHWTDLCTHTNLNTTEGQLHCMAVLMCTLYCTLLRMMRTPFGFCGFTPVHC